MVPEMSQEDIERAQAALAREEKRRETSRAYRERRKNNPEVQAKQKAYSEQRRARQKVRTQALNALAERHQEEFEEILGGLS